MNLRQGIGIVIFLLYSLNLHAFSREDYLKRFLNYLKWEQALPETEEKDFLAFIQEDKPLAQKLREKWLHALGRKKKWALYNVYYKPSSNRHLQCLALLANHYQQKDVPLPFTAIKPLWLNSENDPEGCKTLFQLFLKESKEKETLLTQRIQLALSKSNLALARSLLKQHPLHASERILLQIHQNPRLIAKLASNRLHKIFYLYGFNRWVATELDRALQHWEAAAAQHPLSTKDQQGIVGHVALYKALHNHEDAAAWFAKVLPKYHTELLLAWQIRHALQQQNWAAVEQFIQLSSEKESPAWTYWLARAYEARHHPNAWTLYQRLASQRHYYGFLASQRLKQTFHFEEELPNQNMTTLQAYDPILIKIKQAYQNKQEDNAARLLNAFNLELPKDDKSALAYWVANHLQWKAKAILLSNTDELNNQLSLRFPIAHLKDVQRLSKRYGVAEAFVYAIIRQESGFRNQALSTAGAYGLMQVLPATARVVSKAARLPYHNKSQLFSPSMNLNVSIAYLHQLAQRFHDHPLLIAAAYNAGPKQVKAWLEQFSAKDSDIWIETLPWGETRNYLKNIIAFYAVYQYRLRHKPDIQPFLRPLF